MSFFLVLYILGIGTDLVQPLISLADTSTDAWSRLAKNLANMSRGRIISLKSQLAKDPRGNPSIEAFVADITLIASDLALAGRQVTNEDLSLITHITCVVVIKEDLSAVVVTLASIVGECVDAVLSPNNSNRGGRYCQFCDLASYDTVFCRKLQCFLRENNVTTAPPSRQDGPTVSDGNIGLSDAQWIVDSGASHHVATDPNALNSLMKYGGPDENRLGNVTGLPVKARSDAIDAISATKASVERFPRGSFTNYDLSEMIRPRDMLARFLARRDQAFAEVSAREISG
ncbi:unnamed protein product [Cuscuta campestris]|uniref:Retrotransposon gag domain-containing protein n=1 Tax=Cuscuta campestris TaxID=132261 RepID=A0A484N7P4_9ASTE|nr:unnamed protein product [Cuscuta campestris]